MAQEKNFIKDGIRKNKIEEFLSKEFDGAGYSETDIRRTPMGMRLTIHADKPGMIIGRGGKKINEVTKKLEEEFGMENPQIDVSEIEKPELNAKIVANEIKSAMERGVNRRRICNGILRSIMERGAVGAEIRVSGKLSGSRGRTEKFTDGYLKSCGEPAKRLVDESTTQAVMQPGTIGIKVRIMERMPEDQRKRLEEKRQREEERRKKEEKEEEISEETIDEILSNSISDAKNAMEGIEVDIDDYEKIMEYEKKDKDRKGMKKYLKKKIEDGE
ncbi:MAG: 30S ribosomal protein S3 [Candidatus Aenigmatarchaeota archaeon]